MFNNFTAQAGVISNAGGTGNTNEVQPSITWNFNNVITFDFSPFGTDNINDRPRINTWRSINGEPDPSFLTYLNAGRNVLSPAPSGRTGEFWGNRNIGVYTLPELNISEDNNVIAGVDLFTHSFALPTNNLKPPIDKWTITINPNIPEEVKYQYIFRPGEDNNVNIELEYKPECGDVVLPNCTGDLIFVFVGVNNNDCPQFECNRPFVLGESGNLYPNPSLTWINNAGAANFGKWSFFTEPNTLREIANSNQNGRISIGDQAFFIAGHSGSGVRFSAASFISDEILYNGESLTFNANFSWNKGARIIDILTGRSSNTYIYRIQHQESDALTFERRAAFGSPAQGGTISANAFNQAYNFTISNLGSGMAFQVRDAVNKNLLFSNFYQRTGTNFNCISGIYFYSQLDDITGFGGSLDDWRNYGMFFNSIELKKAPPDFTDPEVEVFPSYVLDNNNELLDNQKSNFGINFGKQAFISQDSELVAISSPRRKHFIFGKPTNSSIGAVHLYTGNRENFWTIDKRFLGSYKGFNTFQEVLGETIDLYKSGNNVILTAYDPEFVDTRSIPITIPPGYDPTNDYYTEEFTSVGKLNFYTKNNENNIVLNTGISLSGSVDLLIRDYSGTDWSCYEETVGPIGGGSFITICDPASQVLLRRTITPVNSVISDFIRNKDFSTFLFKLKGQYIMYTGDPSSYNWSFADSFSTVGNSRDQSYRNWEFIPFPLSMRTNELKWNKIEYSVSEKIWMAIGSGECQGAKSTDGINWTPFNFPVSSNWTDITYGSGKWVVVDNSTNGYYSTNNGQTWSQINFPLPCYKIAYGNGQWKGIPKWQPDLPDINNLNITTGIRDITGKISTSNSIRVSLYTGDINNYKPDILESENGINWINNKLPLNLCIAGLVDRNSKKIYEPIKSTIPEIPIQWTAVSTPQNPLPNVTPLKVPWSDIGYMESANTWCILKKFRPEYNKEDYGTSYYYTSLMSSDGGENWSGSRLFGQNLCINNAEQTFKTVGKIIRGTGQLLYNLPWRNASYTVLQTAEISSGILSDKTDLLNNFTKYSAIIPGKISNDPNFAIKEGYNKLEPDYTPPSIAYTINSTDEFENELAHSTVLPGDSEAGFLYDDGNNTLIYNSRMRWWPVSWKNLSTRDKLPTNSITGFNDINFSTDWFAMPFFINKRIESSSKNLPIYIMEVPSLYDSNFDISTAGMFIDFPILWNTLYTNIASDQEKLISLCSSGVIVGYKNLNNPEWNEISSLKTVVGLSTNLLYGITNNNQFVVFSGDPSTWSVNNAKWYPLENKDSYLKDNSSKNSPFRFNEISNFGKYNNFFSQGFPTGQDDENTSRINIGNYVEDVTEISKAKFMFFDFDRQYTFINTLSKTRPGFSIYNSIPGNPNFDIGKPAITRFREIITAVNTEGEKKFLGVYSIPPNLDSWDPYIGLAPSGAGIYIYEYSDVNFLSGDNGNSSFLRLYKTISEQADYNPLVENILDSGEFDINDRWPILPTGLDDNGNSIIIYPTGLLPIESAPYYYINNYVLPNFYTKVQDTGLFNSNEWWGWRKKYIAYANISFKDLNLNYIPNIITGNRKLYAPIVPTGGFNWYNNLPFISYPWIMKPTGIVTGAASNPFNNPTILNNIYEGLKINEPADTPLPVRGRIRPSQDRLKLNYYFDYEQARFSKINDILIYGSSKSVLTRSGVLVSDGGGDLVGSISIYTGEVPQLKQIIAESYPLTYFGYSYDISSNGNIIVVGAPNYGETSISQYEKQKVGAIHIFTGSTTSEWKRKQTIIGNTVTAKSLTNLRHVGFGQHVRVSDDGKIITVVGIEDPIHYGLDGVRKEFLYIYTGDGISHWAFKQKIEPPPIYNFVLTGLRCTNCFPTPNVQMWGKTLTGEYIENLDINNDGSVIVFGQSVSGVAVYVGDANNGWSFKQFIGNVTPPFEDSDSYFIGANYKTDPNLNFIFGTKNAGAYSVDKGKIAMNSNGSIIMLTRPSLTLKPPKDEAPFNRFPPPFNTFPAPQDPLKNNNWEYSASSKGGGGFKIYNGNPSNGWNLVKAEVISGVGWSQLGYDYWAQIVGANYGHGAAVSDDGTILAISSHTDTWPNPTLGELSHKGSTVLSYPKDSIQGLQYNRYNIPNHYKGGIIIYTGNGQNNWVEKQRIYGLKNLSPTIFKNIYFNENASQLRCAAESAILTFKDSPIPYKPLDPLPEITQEEPLLYLMVDKTKTSVVDLSTQDRCIVRVSGKLKVTNKFFDDLEEFDRRLNGTLTVKINYGDDFETSKFTIVDNISFSAGYFTFDVTNRSRKNNTIKIDPSNSQVFDFSISKLENYGITTGTVELSPRSMSDRMIYPFYFGGPNLEINCECKGCVQLI